MIMQNFYSHLIIVVKHFETKTFHFIYESITKVFYLIHKRVL